MTSTFYEIPLRRLTNYQQIGKNGFMLDMISINFFLSSDASLRSGLPAGPSTTGASSVTKNFLKRVLHFLLTCNKNPLDRFETVAHVDDHLTQSNFRAIEPVAIVIVREVTELAVLVHAIPFSMPIAHLTSDKLGGRIKQECRSKLATEIVLSLALYS